MKGKLESIVSVIVEATEEFEEKPQRIGSHTIVSQGIVGGVVLTKEMAVVYDREFAAARDPGRDYYNKYWAAYVNGRCPLCGIGLVSTLDYYFPKAQYPALALAPTNLLPVCRDCNLGKRKIIHHKRQKNLCTHILTMWKGIFG